MTRYRKEVNARSPMRVFEGSLHGGLGLGHVGVVCAPPGVGKSALLVQLALDDLMRGRRVLHVALEGNVERARAFYDEIFHDLCIAYQTPQPQALRLEVERHRMLVALPEFGPGRRAAGVVARLATTLGFCRDVAEFPPDTVLIDGLDFGSLAEGEAAALSALARDHQVELWVSARSRADETGAAPSSELAPLLDEVNVLLGLHPEGDGLRLLLLKDHDATRDEPRGLWLDPGTLRAVDDALPRPSELARNPARFHLFSGGAHGAEATFGALAERYGMEETHFSFPGHPFLVRERGVLVLGDEELKKGDFSLVYASHRLRRPLSDIPNVKRILQTVWHQVTHADEVFVIGALQEDGTVRGGTGWGAELARLWGKPIAVYDQERGAWFRWDVTRWEYVSDPTITRPRFAGIGTTRLTSAGREAIEQLFERTFGPTH